jgi:mRNA interferase MazF
MKRFDVWLVMKNTEKGRVVDNIGLCAIVSPDELNDLPNLIVAPMTAEFEDLPSRIDFNFEKNKGFIMLDQLRSIDKNNFIKKMGELDSKVQAKLCSQVHPSFL